MKKKNFISETWKEMDRWAIIFPTGMKIMVILMWFFSIFRQVWYWGSWLLGDIEPRAPFLLHVAFFPDVTKEYPFGILLSAGKLPVEAWLLFVIVSTLIMVYGYRGLPAEGLGRTLYITSRNRPPLFFAFMVVLWGIFLFLQIDLPPLR